MDEAERIRRHFDQLGDAEWERLTAEPRSRIALAVHQRLLAEHVGPGSRVLEIGAGPGHFTIAMARLGATVVVTDVSEVQLALNRHHVAEAGCEASVEDRYPLDLREVGRFDTAEFDVVVAYGGPLSYLFEDARAALGEMFRAGRIVVGSVMSTLGSWRFFLPQILGEAEQRGQDSTDLIITTGDLRHQGREEGHTCQMYRSSELVALIEDAGGEALTLSASNWASLGDQETVAAIAADTDGWARFVEHEVRFTREPGATDGGTHILFAAVSRAASGSATVRDLPGSVHRVSRRPARTSAPGG